MSSSLCITKCDNKRCHFLVITPNIQENVKDRSLPTSGKLKYSHIDNQIEKNFISKDGRIYYSIDDHTVLFYDMLSDIFYETILNPDQNANYVIDSSLTWIYDHLGE